MDPNPIRPSRGKARGRPVLPSQLGQPGQPTQPTQLGQPRQPGQPISQIGQPRQPGQPITQPGQPAQLGKPVQPVQFRAPRPSQPITQPTQPGIVGMPRPLRQMPPRPPTVQGPRQSVGMIRPISSGDSQSRQVTALEVQHLTQGIGSLGAGDVPLGRGSVRGRRVIDIEHFRSPRPQSSLGATGKQGTSGQPVNLTANYFPITSYTNWCLYQYRVDFNPEEDRIGTKRGLLSQHRERLGGYLFDGTMLFSGSRYDPDKFELTSKRRSDDQIIVLTVKFTTIIETGDYANIQVFNLLLRNCLRHLELKLIGRNFYDPNAKIDMAQHKLQLWPGYETSIGRYEKDILLCAEISTKVMRQETVLDFLNQCTADRNRNSDWMTTFKSGVVGTTVMTTYNNETYRIDDIDETSDPSSEFLKKDGSKMSYVQYYKEKWNMTIRGGKQPMLISKNKKSIRRFGEDSLVYLVPELCIMTGITDAMRNNFTLMKDMAIHTRVNPSERIKRLTSFANRLLSTPESVDELKRWNLTLSNSLVNVPGRVLAVEQIKSNTRAYDGGMEADWTKHLRSLPMFACAVMNSWVILTPQEYARDAQEFAKTLFKAGQGMSFILPQPNIVTMKDGRSHTILSQLEIVINEKNPSLILCIIQSARGDIYSLIKRKLCIDRSVPSQVVLLKNVQKNNLSVCTKIAIQINCKIGGAPWLVTIPKKGMMIVGFDVCHDSQHKKISYGALVATMNDAHTSYFSCVEPHESGEELSNHFAAGISKALLKYRSKNNGSLPTSLVIFRDGVGEGQISHVHKIEVKLLQTACEQFYGQSSVPLVFIIVTKRINTRFFANSKNNPQNPQPGTVVDSVVTDPTKYDFYLVSQHVRQGTVTPTHYQVIEDTLKLPPDIIQRLTYKLTHMYYNWSGTVRVPAPCQLAHKLAFLTGQTLKAPPNNGLDELLYYL